MSFCCQLIVPVPRGQTMKLFAHPVLPLLHTRLIASREIGLGQEMTNLFYPRGVTHDDLDVKACHCRTGLCHGTQRHPRGFVLDLAAPHFARPVFSGDVCAGATRGYCHDAGARPAPRHQDRAFVPVHFGGCAASAAQAHQARRRPLLCV